jgi:hypothetical protein
MASFVRRVPAAGRFGNTIGSVSVNSAIGN